MVVLNAPPVTGALTRSARVLNWDVKASVVSLMRGFPDRLMERLREQPCAALLALLHRRMQHFDAQAFQTHQDKCDVSGSCTGRQILLMRTCADAETGVAACGTAATVHWKVGLIDSSPFSAAAVAVPLSLPPCNSCCWTCCPPPLAL